MQRILAKNGFEIAKKTIGTAQKRERVESDVNIKFEKNKRRMTHDADLRRCTFLRELVFAL